MQTVALTVAALLATAQTGNATHAQFGTGKVSQLKTIIVGDVSTPNGLSQFDERALSSCGKLIPVVSERREDASPIGTVINQQPGPKEQVACIGSVTLVYSTGPTPPPPQQAPPDIQVSVPRIDSDRSRRMFAANVRQLCKQAFNVKENITAGQPPMRSYVGQEPNEGILIGCREKVVAFLSDGSIPSSKWQMPSLAVAADEDALLNRSAELCSNQSFPIERTEQLSAQAAGTLLNQYPPAGTPLRCGLAVRVVRSKPLEVGLLNSAAARDAFEARAAALCQTPYKVRLRNQPSAAVPGSYISQSDLPETLFDCAMDVSVDIAMPLPASRMPDFIGKDIAAVDQWRAILLANCGSDSGIRILERPSTLNAGVILAQSADAGATYQCGDKIEIAVAAPKTLWAWLAWLAGAIAAALGGAAIVKRDLLHDWLWPSVAELKVGTLSFSVSAGNEAPTRELPFVALETLNPAMTFTYPDGLPLESVETSNG